jgi:hypothetical protein
MHVLRVMYKYSVEEYRTPLSDGFLSVVRKIFEFLRDVQSLELEDSLLCASRRIIRKRPIRLVVSRYSLHLCGSERLIVLYLVRAPS